MNPLAAAVTRATKPTLITAQDLFPQRRGVNGLIQAKELRLGRNQVRVGIRGVGYREPRPGDLIGNSNSPRLFQLRLPRHSR